MPSFLSAFIFFNSVKIHRLLQIILIRLLCASRRIGYIIRIYDRELIGFTEDCIAGSYLAYRDGIAILYRRCLDRQALPTLVIGRNLFSIDIDFTPLAKVGTINVQLAVKEVCTVDHNIRYTHFRSVAGYLSSPL